MPIGSKPACRLLGRWLARGHAAGLRAGQAERAELARTELNGYKARLDGMRKEDGSAGSAESAESAGSAVAPEAAAQALLTEWHCH